jgi:hypothetical protein
MFTSLCFNNNNNTITKCTDCYVRMVHISRGYPEVEYATWIITTCLYEFIESVHAILSPLYQDDGDDRTTP